MKMLLILLLITSQTFAQSTANMPANPSSSSSADISAFSLDKVKAKFKINYFSETLGPSIKKLDDNEISDEGTKNHEPTTMYHSFNVRYLLTKDFNLFMSPRVATAIGDRNDLRPNADQHVVIVDDWQFGFYYTFISRPTLNYSQTITHRAPFSVKSRNENIDSQVEWNHFVTWAITPELRMLHWTNLRHYEFNDEATEERYRVSWRTIFTYSFNDKWNTQLGYELDLQHRNTIDTSSPRHRDLNYMKRYHSYTSVALGYSPVPNFTILPFIRTLDERNIRNETTIVGLWLLGKVL